MGFQITYDALCTLRCWQPAFLGSTPPVPLAAGNADETMPFHLRFGLSPVQVRDYLSYDIRNYLDVRPTMAAAEMVQARGWRWLASTQGGSLVANRGTPDGTDYWSMRRYLNEFLSDKRVVDYSAWIWQPLLQLIILTKRPFSSGAAYKSIWNEEDNESPLLTITKKQTAAIKQQMIDRYGDDVRVDFCMRYGNPSTKSKVREMVDAGCTKILFFPLYPHYAGATSATANDQFFRALMEEKWQPVARVVEPYFEDPAYIDALAQSIEKAYADAETKPEKLVCSYHGVP